MMVIRIFDDTPRTVPATAPAAVPVAGDGNHVACPTCQGDGEYIVGQPTQNSDGVWEADLQRCTACDGTGVVSAEEAIEVDCCTDSDGRPVTRWRGDRCGLEHELFCDDHLPRCHDGCGSSSLHDDDPWTAALLGRSA